MCNRKNFLLIDQCKNTKAICMNSSRFQLNGKGANILSSTLTQHISNVFSWKLSGITSCYNDSESYFEENESSYLKQTKEKCKDNLDKLIFVHLNINSIRNKFDFLSEQNRSNVDVLLVSETKIDDSFPQGRFIIVKDGFSAPCRLDPNCLDGALMLLVREDIPSNLLTIEEKPVENFYVIASGLQIALIILIGIHLGRISESLDLLSSDYEKIIFSGDFNVTDDENHINLSLKTLHENCSLKNLISQPTCYKNPSKPACIDRILTNVSLSFQSTCLV